MLEDKRDRFLAAAFVLLAVLAFVLFSFNSKKDTVEKEDEMRTEVTELAHTNGEPIANDASNPAGPFISSGDAVLEEAGYPDMEGVLTEELLDPTWLKAKDPLAGIKIEKNADKPVSSKELPTNSTSMSIEEYWEAIARLKKANAPEEPISTTTPKPQSLEPNYEVAGPWAGPDN